MSRTTAIEMKSKIAVYLSNAGLFYGMFNLPSKKPRRLCISDDTSMHGNCWGKLVIEGRTWGEIYGILVAIDITPAMIAGRKLHEAPDNIGGNMVAITDIKYDFDCESDAAPEKIIAVIPSVIRTMDEAADFLSDYISEKTGYCHFGFAVSPEVSSLYRK